MNIIKQKLKSIKGTDKRWRDVAQARLNTLTKPGGSLGMLEELAAKLVTIYESDIPEIPEKAVITFAGDHGVAEEGVSAFPGEVTPQMVFNFLRGGAAVNVLAKHAGVDVIVVDIGVNYDFHNIDGLENRKVIKGTRNMKKEPAMTVEETVQCITAGIELAEKYGEAGYKMFAAGEMGIANTTSASAITSLITGISVRDATGRGTGIGKDALEKKIAVIEEAITINAPDCNDPIDILSKTGGAEIAGIAGLCIGAASLRLPVVIDGFISTAGALTAYCMNPALIDYMFASHISEERGHRAALKYMGMTPLLDLGLRLGEGTGAVLAMTLLDASLKLYSEMATFDEAGVSDKDGVR